MTDRTQKVLTAVLCLHLGCVGDTEKMCGEGTIRAKAFKVIFHVDSFIILMFWCVVSSDTFVSLVCERNDGPLDVISEDSFHFPVYQWTTCMETWTAVDVCFYPLELWCFVYCISGPEDFCKHPTECLKMKTATKPGIDQVVEVKKKEYSLASG